MRDATARSRLADEQICESRSRDNDMARGDFDPGPLHTRENGHIAKEATADVFATHLEDPIGHQRDRLEEVLAILLKLARQERMKSAASSRSRAMASRAMIAAKMRSSAARTLPSSVVLPVGAMTMATNGTTCISSRALLVGRARPAPPNTGISCERPMGPTLGFFPQFL